MLRTLVVLLLPLGSLAVTVTSSRHRAVQSDVQPTDLSAGPTWSWHHPKGRAHTITFGVKADGEGNLYLTCVDGIRKFSPDGQVLWEHNTKPPNWVYNAAALGDGKVFAATTTGWAFALDAKTGNVTWQKKVSGEGGRSHGFTNAENGIVVTESGGAGGTSYAVSGLNWTDGTTLWTYRPGHQLWNFGAVFPGDGSLTFQDRVGNAYRLQANDGTLLWKSQRPENKSFGEGAAALDSDGNVYTVENLYEAVNETTGGKLIKRSLSDGQIMWNVTTPYPPNNAPIIGHGLVIQPMGLQRKTGVHSNIYAYDENTGELKWTFEAPAMGGQLQAGDSELALSRMQIGVPAFCWTNSWSSPAFGPDGTLYIGHQEGGFYGLRDVNGDGTISGDGELTSIRTMAAYGSSATPVVTPGMVAMANCDTLFVYKH